MKYFVMRLAVTLCVLSGSADAIAQAQRAPIAPAQAAAQADIDPNTLAGTALRILQAVDRDQVSLLWDGASAVTRRTTRREDFLGQVARTRKPLGTVAGRNWMAVRRQQVAVGGQLPPGTYTSVEFATRFQNNRIAKELVSMRRDEDGVWRFTGYVIE